MEMTLQSIFRPTTEFLHLLGRQLACPIGSAPRYQAVHTEIIVAVNPIAQGLPVHSSLSGQILAVIALHDHCDYQ